MAPLVGTVKDGVISQSFDVAAAVYQDVLTTAFPWLAASGKSADEISLVTQAFVVKEYEATPAFGTFPSTLFCNQLVGRVGGVLVLKSSLQVWALEMPAVKIAKASNCFS